MPVDAAAIQRSILNRTGDFSPTTGDALPIGSGGGFLAQQIASVWAQYADKAFVAPRLQELYVERDLIERYIGALQRDYDFSGDGASFSRSKPVDRLIARRDKVSDEIAATEAMVAANRAPAVGPILTSAPIAPPYPNGIDANSRRYGGDPYFRRPWGYP